MKATNQKNQPNLQIKIHQASKAGKYFIKPHYCYLIHHQTLIIITIQKT